MASVRLSDIMLHDRMDAGFHIALVHLRGSIEYLRSRYTDEDAIALLDALPVQAKTAMSVLKRGSNPRAMTNAESHDLAIEYPHLALGLVQEDAKESILAISEQIAKSSKALDLLIGLSGADGCPDVERAAS